LAMMSVTPALAAPRQIEDFCFEQSRHVTFWHRGDYEAFMANCIRTIRRHQPKNASIANIETGSVSRRGKSNTSLKKEAPADAVKGPPCCLSPISGSLI